MAKITKQQYEELVNAYSLDEQKFVEKLEEYTGITRKAYTSYKYYCGGDYVGGSECHTLHDILCNADVTVTEEANEKRLIDANDVYALFGQNGMARLHVADIDVIATVDAVEVVRCKDCKAWNRYEPTSVSGRCGFLSRMRMDDDFCSYGERKENE